MLLHGDACSIKKWEKTREKFCVKQYKLTKMIPGVHNLDMECCQTRETVKTWITSDVSNLTEASFCLFNSQSQRYNSIECPPFKQSKVIANEF